MLPGRERRVVDRHIAAAAVHQAAECLHPVAVQKRMFLLIDVGTVAEKHDGRRIVERLGVIRPALCYHNRFDAEHVRRVIQTVLEEPRPFFVFVRGWAVTLFAGDQDNLLGGRSVTASQ